MKPTGYLKRFNSDSKETLGSITITIGGATFTCNTLELSWLNNLTNISCVPIGTYSVVFISTPHFPQGIYQLQNVPNRIGVDIHSGNTFHDSLACILLGSQFNDINNDGEEDVINSRTTLEKFETFLSRKPFTLIIS